MMSLSKDFTSKESFSSLEYIYEMAKSTTKQTTVLMLVGCKCDLVEQYNAIIRRQVSMDIAMEYAEKHGMLFYECSSKNLIKIEDIFVAAVREVLKKVRSNEIDDRDEVYR